MSLLLRSGDQHFEISEADLQNYESSEDEFANTLNAVADRDLVAESPVTIVMQTPIGSGCSKPTYGASCSKAPNCP